MRTIVFLIVLLMVTLSVPQHVNAQRADFLPDDLKKFVTIDSTIIAIENVRIIDGTGVPAAPPLVQRPFQRAAPDEHAAPLARPERPDRSPKTQPQQSEMPDDGNE